MVADIYTFRRREKKYRINSAQKAAFLNLVADHLYTDEHGVSTISSLYLDTPSFLLIRNSIDAKAYKEKLRIRSYGTPLLSDLVFFEIKKKYKGTVYKRRIKVSLGDALCYIDGGAVPESSQIMNEIDYAMHFYNFPKPAMLIFYEREAYFSKTEHDVRITFDTNIRFRNSDLALEKGSAGTAILPENELIMEIKTGGAMPLWLTEALGQLCLYPASFSKYANAYRSISNDKNTQKGDLKNVSNI